MNKLMDKLFGAKGAIITAAMGDRVISTTCFVKPMVCEFDDYFEVADDNGNEILFEKDFIETMVDDDGDFVVKYGVVDYYITLV